jgi:hypothetical protein
VAYNDVNVRRRNNTIGFEARNWYRYLKKFGRESREWSKKNQAKVQTTESKSQPLPQKNQQRSIKQINRNPIAPFPTHHNTLILFLSAEALLPALHALPMRASAPLM